LRISNEVTSEVQRVKRSEESGGGRREESQGEGNKERKESALTVLEGLSFLPKHVKSLHISLPNHWHTQSSK
jgi:hypothetical protein